MNFKFENGDKVKDQVTEFEGVITARADYITGCNQYSITSQKDPDKSYWFDESRLTLTKSGAVNVYQTPQQKLLGGPAKGSPKG